LPGNHDWYDGLVGFVYHLCGAEALAPADAGERASSLKEWLRLLLWRRAATRSPEELPVRRRTEAGRRSSQRAPYFAIETGPLLIVGIDTGIGGAMDHEQGQWLRRVSRAFDKPKLLLTGKPLYVDGEHHPGEIEGGSTVDETASRRRVAPNTRIVLPWRTRSESRSASAALPRITPGPRRAAPYPL
jgi:hypothetical protein